MQSLDRFMALAAVALEGAATGPALPAARRVRALLDLPPQPASPAPRHDLPVRRHLPAACAATRPDLADAFLALEPAIPWRTRTLSNAGPGFADGHASARVLDPAGLEQRGGLIAGFSLVAPGVTYPEHDHPPEELYLVLSGGEWWQAGGDWHAPGPCGFVHNPPGIRHAMRAGTVPLLAAWFLLPG